MGDPFRFAGYAGERFRQVFTLIARGDDLVGQRNSFEVYGDPGLIAEPLSAFQFHLMAIAKSNCAVDYLARLQGQHRPEFAQLIVGHFQRVVAQHHQIGELARFD